MPLPLSWARLTADAHPPTRTQRAMLRLSRACWRLAERIEGYVPGGWDEIAADDPTLERPGCLRCRAVDAVGNQADWVRRRLRDRWLARGRAQDEAGMAENREAPRVQKSGPT